MELHVSKESLGLASQKLVARLNALGVTKDGKPLVVDQGFEGIAAMLGFRNQHALRAALGQEQTQSAVAQPTEVPLPTEDPQALLALETRWGYQHGYYDREDWKYDVANGNTKLGYWVWVLHAIESNGGDEEHCSNCGTPRDGGSWDGLCGNCTAAASENCEDLADSLGVDLDDVKFWVGLHYKRNFDTEPNAKQVEWLHRYREMNGLTPEDDAAETGQTPDEAFEAYDFGDWIVVDHDGWMTAGTRKEKKVYLVPKDDQGQDSVKRIFIVEVSEDNEDLVVAVRVE